VPVPGLLQRTLRYDRLITMAALLLAWLLACLYLLRGAGMNHMMMPMNGAPAWDAGTVTTMIAMWWVMMVAMMIPSAAPTILLFSTVHQSHARRGTLPGTPPALLFLAGYLGIWFVFSLAATALQFALSRLSWLSTDTMAIHGTWITATVLALAGLYQLSPMKQACLAHCRAPAAFLAAHWRPGPVGAARLGIIHGSYCLGCCWMLMLLLFVGGVMNPLWIAALGSIVLAEKLAPAGDKARRPLGIMLLLAAAGVTLG